MEIQVSESYVVPAIVVRIFAHCLSQSHKHFTRVSSRLLRLVRSKNRGQARVGLTFPAIASALGLGELILSHHLNAVF